MILPCRGQELRWRPEEQEKYRRLLAAADKTVYLSERYFDGCMRLRNEYLVQHSGICVTYFTHGRSGTGQTVRLAREQGLTVINLAE